MTTRPLRFPLTLGALTAAVGAQFAGDPTLPAPSDPATTPTERVAQLQWGDFDADGLDEVAAVAPDGTLTLLHNQGDGTFADVTQPYGFDTVSDARFTLWHDFDQDGLTDLFVGTASGPSRLFHNAGVFFVDDANGLVGIGTTTPSDSLSRSRETTPL